MRAALQLRQLVGGGSAHLEHDVGAERLGRAADARAGGLDSRASGMLAATPAPDSTTIACLPLAASFLTVSGVAATRVSPGRVSRGMPIIMVIAPLAADRVGRYLATRADRRA